VISRSGLGGSKESQLRKNPVASALADEPAVSKNEAIVLAVLRSARRALKAYEILGRTARRGIRAPTQVYRALEGLSHHGLVHRIETLNAYLVCGRGPHVDEVAFAVCVNCSNVDEVPLAEVGPELRDVAAQTGFETHKTQVEFSGLCASCKQEGHAAHG
jgi:Fur family zinc uptake transcriptional regulator